MPHEQSCQRAEDVGPTRTRILTYQPVWARFKTEIKNITLNFKKILIKKENEFYPSTVTPVTNSSIHTKCSLSFIPEIAKTLWLSKNLNFAPASGPIEARQFFKIQDRSRPALDPTRPEKPESDWQLCTGEESALSWFDPLLTIWAIPVLVVFMTKHGLNLFIFTVAYIWIGGKSTAQSCFMLWVFLLYL